MRFSVYIARSVAATSTVMLLALSIHAAAAQSPDATVDHTAREEAEGKAVWGRLQTKEISCGGLSEEDYGVLGEYFMGLMLGDTRSHEAMNRNMTIMMGEDGEEQMHVAMGKRLSSCDASAAFPAQGRAYTSTMMGMMGPWMTFGASGAGAPYGMMGYGISSWNWTGWITQLLVWTVLVLAAVALARWSTRQGKK